MRLSKCGENDYSWIDALSKSKQPIKDKEEHLLSQVDGKEVVEGALEGTVEAAFGVAAPRKSNAEMIQEASVKIQQDRRQQQLSKEINTIKQKLADNNVDPVALGVIEKDKWTNCQDPSEIERIAKVAALKQIEFVRNGWQKKAMESRTSDMKYDPMTSREGRIMSSSSSTEDGVAAVIDRQIPANSASIFDPNRIDKMASGENAHDKSVKESREAQNAKKESSKNWRTEEHIIPEDLNIMKQSAIAKANSFETIENRSRVPSNQISMADDISGDSPQTIKEKLAQLFTRIPDTKQDIREANRARKESIQREQPSQEEKRSWEKNSKPVSTSDLQKKLVELWIGKSE